MNLSLAIFTFVLAIWSANTIADTLLNTNTLTPAQIAELEERAATLRKENAAGGGPLTSKQVSEWVDIGTNIGKGLSGAAKEVGIAVNDFVQTPVGMMTAAIIIWKFMGGVILHFFGGLLVLLSSWLFMLYISRRMTMVTIEYSPDKTDVFGRARITSVGRSKLSEDWAGGMFLWMATSTIVAIVVIFSY